MYRVWWPQAKQGHGARFRLLVDALRHIIKSGHYHDAWLRKEPVQGQDHEPWQPAESFVLPARFQPAAAQQSSPAEPAAAQGARDRSEAQRHIAAFKTGDKCRKGQVLVKWDPHRIPILAEKSGVVKFKDVEELTAERDAEG